VSDGYSSTVPQGSIDGNDGYSKTTVAGQRTFACSDVRFDACVLFMSSAISSSKGSVTFGTHCARKTIVSPLTNGRYCERQAETDALPAAAVEASTRGSSTRSTASACADNRQHTP